MKIDDIIRGFGCILFIIALSVQTQAQSTAHYLTEDGAWCWFSDPRAIMVDGEVITGWVTSNGTIEAARLNPQTRKAEFSDLYFALEVDDHNNPAFTVTESGKVISMYTRHSRKDLFINTLEPNSENFSFYGAQLIHPWNQEQLEKFPRQTMTYANPYYLEDEKRIYSFGRWTGFKPNMIWSDDEGETWSDAKVFITNYPFNSNNRPYVKYSSDGKSKIHFVFTDGHPRVEPTNSVYYAYYENGSFYKAGGDKISSIETIPFEPKEASVVYTSNTEQGRAWVADISQDENNNPTILYTRSPSENNHEYWYARYTEDGWVDQKITDSGKWFPQTPEGQREREPHYFGGMALHPDNPNIVYLSREVDGTFEIERWETTDLGATWTSEAITSNSEFDNVRPYVPQGLSQDEEEVVLWMENQKYIHYTDYKTSIKYMLRSK